jgi:hypothetical protein
MEARKGYPYLLAWQELLSCEHLAMPTAGTLHIQKYSSMSKILMRANTLAFSFIAINIK